MDADTLYDIQALANLASHNAIDSNQLLASRSAAGALLYCCDCCCEMMDEGDDSLAETGGDELDALIDLADALGLKLGQDMEGKCDGKAVKLLIEKLAPLLLAILTEWLKTPPAAEFGGSSA